MKDKTIRPVEPSDDAMMNVIVMHTSKSYIKQRLSYVISVLIGLIKCNDHLGVPHCLFQGVVTTSPYLCLGAEHLYGPQFSACRGNVHRCEM